MSWHDWPDLGDPDPRRTDRNLRTAAWFIAITTVAAHVISWIA